MAAGKSVLVKISHVTVSLSIYKGSKSGDLNSISFSIQNLSDRPLVWVKLRALIRSNTGELIQTETFEQDLSGTGSINKPLGPKEARQLTHYVTINGFMLDGRRGSVDLRLSDFRFAEEDQSQKAGTKRESPKQQAKETPERTPSARAKGKGVERDLESTGQAAIKDFEFLVYRNQMLRLIRDRWTWVGKRADLEVTVRFAIRENGQITDLGILRASGDASYDDSVLRAVAKASPLPPPPENYRKESMDVELTFRPKDLGG